MSKNIEGELTPLNREMKETTVVFHDKGFKRTYGDRGGGYKIENTYDFDTSVGSFVQDGNTWYKVVSSDPSDDRYGRHHGTGAKIAEGEANIEQIIKKAGELSGNERETGFKVDISLGGTDTGNRFIARPRFVPRDNWEIWEKACEKYKGGLSYRIGLRSVAFESQNDAEKAVEEAGKEYENMIHGEKK